MQTDSLHMKDYLLRSSTMVGGLSIIAVSFKYSDITPVTKWTDTVYVNLGSETIYNVVVHDTHISHLFAPGVFKAFKTPRVICHKLEPLEACVHSFWISADYLDVSYDLTYEVGGRSEKTDFTIIASYPDYDDFSSHGVYNLLEWNNSEDSHQRLLDPSTVAFRESISEVQSNPHLLKLTSPTNFEQIVGNLFTDHGFDVEHVGKTNDGGIDLLALSGSPPMDFKIIIQCKRYKNKVGVAPVRELYGVKQDIGASKAVLVTTSSFTKGAVEFAERNCWELELIDFEKLSGLFQSLE